MSITYVDNGLDKSIAQLGEALIKRLNYKNERAQQLASNPATLMALAPAYRQAKEAGQEANFFAGLQVDPSFGRLLDAYPETPEQQANRLENKVKIATAQSTLSSGIIDKQMEENLLKTNLGTSLLKGYNSYINDLPDTPLGNHLKKMAGVAFANPGLMDEIQRHEAVDNKGNGDPLIEYDRWRTSYNNALDRFRKADTKDKASAMVDVNNLAVIGEDLQKQGKIPLAPITGVREARKFMGLGKKLEEFNMTPELINPAALAAQSVLDGKTPEGKVVTLDDLKKSKFYNSLDATDQGKLTAAITSAQSENANKPADHPDNFSYWDAATGALGDVAKLPFKAMDKGVELGLKGASSMIAKAKTGKNPLDVENADAKPNVDKSTNIPATSPVDRLSNWAQKMGFEVTSTTGGKHNTGSLHGQGLAIDVRTKDKSPAEIAKLISEASMRGLRVLDERKKPAGQKVWDGPHIHLEINPAKNPSKDIGLEEYINSVLNRLDMGNR